MNVGSGVEKKKLSHSPRDQHWQQDTTGSSLIGKLDPPEFLGQGTVSISLHHQDERPYELNSHCCWQQGAHFREEPKPGPQIHSRVGELRQQKTATAAARFVADKNAVQVVDKTVVEVGDEELVVVVVAFVVREELD